MIGIKAIASYLCEDKVDIYEYKNKFNLKDSFLEKKIGIKYLRRKKENEKASDLCVKSFEKLAKQVKIEKDKIDCLVVVTQNPDYNIPHTSAIVHGKLELSEKCACFDISLGCSGYVYGLSIIKSFMEANNMKYGLLFTSDPYSEIINSDDKNTSLLFGDGASVTLLTNDAEFVLGKFSYGTIGTKYEHLMCKNNQLYMDGFEIFNFVCKYIPKDIKYVLKQNELEKDDVDVYILHQASKYIVDTLRKKMQLPSEKVKFDICNYGNTISSSIPIILAKEMEKISNKIICISGFGVGLSWGTGIIYRNKTLGE
jgi:3-oxoacyl-[acyl-carrier-protein] synthase-3